MTLIPMKMIAGLVAALNAAVPQIKENWSPGLNVVSSGGLGTISIVSTDFSRWQKEGNVYDFQIQINYEVTGNSVTGGVFSFDAPEIDTSSSTLAEIFAPDWGVLGEAHEIDLGVYLKVIKSASNDTSFGVYFSTRAVGTYSLFVRGSFMQVI